jgi:transposase-like protein
VNDQQRAYWGKLIAGQEASGQAIAAFCQQRGIADNSFYRWRQRLQKSEPVQFALLKTVDSEVPLELCLTNGERLRIGSGVDAATLRLVLEALRS